MPAADYIYREYDGVVETVARKKNANNRDYAEVLISGVEFSIWEPQLIAMAEAFKDAQVGIHVNARSKKMPDGNPGRFWSVVSMEPHALQESLDTNGQGAQAGLVAPVAEVMAQAGLDTGAGKGVRLRTIELAVQALSGREEVADPNKVIMYALTLERHIAQ